MKFLKHLSHISAAIQQALTYEPLRAAKHAYENGYLKAVADLNQLLCGGLEQMSVLVVGCGYAYPEVILLSQSCHDVTGLDIRCVFYRDGLLKTLNYIKKQQGLMRALLFALVWKWKYSRFYACLEEISGVPIRHEVYRLVSYDGEQMPFPSKTFDVVLSGAVLEHVQNLESFFQEICRVTKMGGISYHLWHNYYSLSGGHVGHSLAHKYPWGHLRGKYETHGLNKLRPAEIQRIFSKYFDLIALYGVDQNHRKRGADSDFHWEGETLLSPTIQNELHAIPRELLLTRAFLIIARKKLLR